LKLIPSFFLKFFRNGGLRRFYVGIGPCLLRSFPANAACLYAYEATRKLLN